MISVGSRDGRKGLGLGLEMEDVELEEGEALGGCYNDVAGDSTVDPDIALSYIEEKLQNVLGHFQKDFEGGVSAENLGAKFGGYGSFLPTYQRSPSWSHTKSPQNIQSHATPRSSRKLHPEDQIQNSFASSTATPSARPLATSGKTSSMGNYSKGNVCVPSNHTEEFTPKSGVSTKYVDPSDQRTLKVRIKVGAENLSTQKNADIYSGLGLVVSPSSSLDDSPSTSQRLCGDEPDESPTSILQIMTNFPEHLLLSPLSEDLLYLTERRKPRVKTESKSVNKTSIENSGTPVNGSRFSRSNQKVVEQKKVRYPEENDAFFTDLTKQKRDGDQDNTGSLLKKDRETNFDTLGCEELVSNALKLPLLSSSEYPIADPVPSTSPVTTAPVRALKDRRKEETFSEGRLDSKFSHDIGSFEKSGGKISSSGKLSESKKENLVSDTAAYSQHDVFEAAKPHSSDQSESNFPRGRNSRSAEPIDSSKQLVVQKGGSLTDEGFKPARKNSSIAGKKKQKGLKNQLIADSSVSTINGKLSHSLLSETQKDSEKPMDRYKEFFGEFEDGDNESISGELASSARLKDTQSLVKRSLNESTNKSKEKCNIRSSERPYPSETYPRAGSHVPTPVGNEPNSEAPPPNDDWVCCERCQKWRLLPLGMDPKSLPETWLCRMLTWLPGMNRCSIPEDITTSSVKALYHPVGAVPAPAAEGQLDGVGNQVRTSVGVASVDARHSVQEQPNIANKTSTVGGKKKHGSKNPANSTEFDGSTHSSNSKRKSLPASTRNGNSSSGNQTPLDAGGFQNVKISSSDVERHNDNKKDKKVSLVSCSDKGANLKIRSKRDSDLDGPRLSKRMKSEELRDDENWTSDNGESFLKAGRGSSSGLSINASESDREKYANNKNLREGLKKNIFVATNAEVQVPGTSADDLPRSSKSDDKDSIRKRKWKDNSNSQIRTEPVSSSGRRDQESSGLLEEMYEKGPRKEKKARVSKSGVKDSSAGKDQKGKSTDCLKSDMGSVQHSAAANSSSSKVSGSHKKKTNAQEINGSPVESVSSSPLRFSASNADKITSTRSNLEKTDIHDSGPLTAVCPRRFSVGEDAGGYDQGGIVKKDPILTVNDRETDVGDHLRQSNQYFSEKHTLEQSPMQEKINTDQSRNSGSHSKKSGKGLSSQLKERDHASGSDLEQDKMKSSDFPHDSLTRVHLYDEKSKNRKIQLDEKSGTPQTASKFVVKKDGAGGTISEVSKGQNKMKSGGHDGQDKRQHLQKEHEDEKLPTKHNQVESNGNGKSHLLPPLARGQAEISGSQRQYGSKSLAADALDNGDSSKAPHQSKKAEKQNGQPIILRHATPNSYKGRDVEAPSPIRRDSSSYTANSALKEAKDLKHAADRLKNSGSTDSTGCYFQAALKFLQGASLLESGHGDIKHALHIYSTTANLCDFCAREYERSRDMAAAALAYKCMEVAYMRVVSSSNTTASRDRIELQSALQIVPPGESPSSSASDVDNLNHQVTTDKAALAKVVESPQVSGSHIITSRNRSCVSRLLTFAENVNLAMEASRKSRNAFTAATSVRGETSHTEGIGSVKRALDFNFQDVEVLLRLVRVAMEDITR